MPLDLLITGQIATLAGPAGFGWVEAVGIRDGRIAFAGSEVDLETRADPFTQRIALADDEVAIPGLTDAHLHLVQTAMARHQVDLTTAATVADGMAMIGAAHARASNPDTWIEGHGWDADRWGRWPTAEDIERAAPGRRVAVWAHDHHALLTSHAALRASGIADVTPDPPGGVIRRSADGRPDGVLYESASRLVTVHVPPMDPVALALAIADVGRELVSLGVVACHDPGGVAPDPDLTYAFPAYAHLADAGDLPLRVHASFRDDALDTAIAGGLRSGMILGSDPAGRARIGWQKCFADGSLGSRTAGLLEDIEPEADQPLPPDRRRGVWMTPPDALHRSVGRAAAAGIASQIHAIGDAAVRAALDVLTANRPDLALLPRVEHAQMVHPDDRARFATEGIAASVQPVHLGSDAAKARLLWGDRAESRGYAWASLASTGAVLAFGTDAPVEPFDPWPGIALAVTREDPAWPVGTPAFGPGEALSLDRALRAACIDPAVCAGELDRGRLIPGHRADIAIIHSASIEEPVTPGGALSGTRPTLVLMDGVVVFER